MAINFSGDCVNELYLDAFNTLQEKGISVVGRNGLTKELLHICFTLSNPKNRWTTVRKPAISLAFAFAEIIMLINGSDDARLINRFNSKLPEYQGDYEYLELTN